MTDCQHVFAETTVVSASTTPNPHEVQVTVVALKDSVMVKGLRLSKDVLHKSVDYWVGDPVRLHKHRDDGAFMVPTEDFSSASDAPIVGRVSRAHMDGGDLKLTLNLDRRVLSDRGYEMSVGNPISTELVVRQHSGNVQRIEHTNGVTLLTGNRKAECSPEDGCGVSEVIAASKVCSCSEEDTVPTKTDTKTTPPAAPAPAPKLADTLKGMSPAGVLALASEAGIDGLQVAPETPPEDTAEVKALREKAAAFDKLDAERRQATAQKLLDLGFIVKEKLDEYAERSYDVLSELLAAAKHGTATQETVAASKNQPRPTAKPMNTSASPESKPQQANGVGPIMTMAAIRKAQQEATR